MITATLKFVIKNLKSSELRALQKALSETKAVKVDLESIKYETGIIKSRIGIIDHARSDLNAYLNDLVEDIVEYFSRD